MKRRKSLPVLYRAAEDFYESTVAHRVEETLQVEVNHINVAIIDYFPISPFPFLFVLSFLFCGYDSFF